MESPLVPVVLHHYWMGMGGGGIHALDVSKCLRDKYEDRLHSIRMGVSLENRFVWLVVRSTHPHSVDIPLVRKMVPVPNELGEPIRTANNRRHPTSLRAAGAPGR